MLADVDVVFLDYVALEEDVEALHFSARFRYGLLLEVELQLAIRVEMSRPFVLDVQLGEEGALQQIVDFIPLLHLDVFPQFRDDQLIHFLFQD